MTSKIKLLSNRLTFSSIFDRIAFPLAAVAIVLTHLWLTFYFEKPEALFGGEPIIGGDFDGHIAQSFHVMEGLEYFGKTWVYDFKVQAGYPVGAISDANHKAWELVTYVCWKLGLHKGPAHNVFVLLAHFLVLPSVYWAARFFGIGRRFSLVAMAFGSAIWFFDSFAHWLWWIGMVSFATASYLSLLTLAIFYRYLQDRRFWQAALASVLLGICHLVHAYSFVVLVVPMGALYIRYFKKLSKAQHAAVALLPLMTLAINGYWLIVAMDFWRYLIDSSFYCAASPIYIFTDFLSLLIDTSTTGVIGTRTGFRFLFIAASILMLVLWKRSGDARFLPFAAALGTTLSLAYFGAYVELFSQVQPYRNMLPAAFIATVPAAGLIELAWQNRHRVHLPKAAYIGIAILFLPGIQHLSDDILYYFLDLLPKVPDAQEGIPIYYTANGYGPQMEYIHKKPKPSDYAVADWVNQRNDGRSRFLVQYNEVGERLPWKTDAEILGGFQYRNLTHAYSNYFKPRDDIVFDDLKTIQEYLNNFAIRYVIVNPHDPAASLMLPLLRPITTMGPLGFYENKEQVSLFMHGHGQIRTTINRIEVRGTNPDQDIVLKYNWLHTLICEPFCSVKREPNKFSKIGFLRIPAPHRSNFVISNNY